MYIKLLSLATFCFGRKLSLWLPGEIDSLSPRWLPPQFALVPIVLVFALILQGGLFVKTRLSLWTSEAVCLPFSVAFFWTAQAPLVVSHAFFSASSLQCLLVWLLD